MNEIVKPDRGTVKRITFDLLYPNGQLKTITLENNSIENIGTFSLIVLDEHGMNNFLLSNAGATNKSNESIIQMWNEKETGEYAQWPPAILIVNTDGEIMKLCGGHKQLISPEVIIK